MTTKEPPPSRQPQEKKVVAHLVQVYDYRLGGDSDEGAFLVACLYAQKHGRAPQIQPWIDIPHGLVKESDLN